MTDDALAQPQAPGADTAHDWPMRPWLLAGLLGLAGLLIHLVTHDALDSGWRAATAAFVLFGSVAAALSIEREHWRGPALFALVLGLVMAGLAWRAVQYGEYLPDEQYGFGAGVVASLLALPLFQAGFLKTRFATPYAQAHYHVWNDALCGAGAILFTGLAWLVLNILSELFRLLKIDVLRDLMDHGWFGWTFSGLAFGAALGTLKNQAKVLGTLQSVAMLVLSLLAVPLAFGLAVFLLATAVSGPQVLWDATRSATPVLLVCAVGAFGLANAVVRSDDAEMTRNRVLRVAGAVLAAVILPLALFAAVSMGLRLHQYGLAPERLWGLVAIAVACAFGLAYWVALVRGRKTGWAAKLRHANLNLAVGVGVLAVLLALPILNFASISTANQLARLESGRVSAQDFDYAALRWDFGEPGRKALARLAKGTGDVARFAKVAQAQTERTWFREEEAAASKRLANLRVQGNDPALQRALVSWLQGVPGKCESRCTAIALPHLRKDGRKVLLVEGYGYSELLVKPDGTVEERFDFADFPIPKGTPGTDPKVELRPWRGARVYVDGSPIGMPVDEPLDGGNAPLEGGNRGR